MDSVDRTEAVGLIADRGQNPKELRLTAEDAWLSNRFVLTSSAKIRLSRLNASLLPRNSVALNVRYAALCSMGTSW